MPKFLITYSGIGHPSHEAMKEAQAEFSVWLACEGSSVTDPGAPVARRARVADGEPAPAADIIGYSIIEVESTAAAMELLQSHPYIARGGTLQVNEFL